LLNIGRVKSPKAIVLLLLLNLGVFVAILHYFRQARLEASRQLNASESASLSKAEDEAPAPKPQPVEKVVVVTNHLQWAQLESEDYKTYIARLRSIGCPEQTIRDIIIADLDKLLAPEVQAAAGHRADLKYWQSIEEELANDVDPREVAKKQREIDRRKREIIRELVNTDLNRERLKLQGQEDYYERRLRFLPEARRDQVRGILEKYDEDEQDIRERGSEDGPTLNESDRAQLRALAMQRQAELAQTLSAEEKAQYELWLSPTANAVRYALYGMNATEQEFLAVYQARKSFDEKWAVYEPESLDDASRTRMEQARAEVSEQIREALGDQRYAEYKRGEDEDFHLLSAAATRARLAKEKAAEVYGYKLLAQAYRDQVRNDPNFGPQQKDETLKAISTETEKAIRASLGEKGYRRYVASGGGKWLKE
jgi:hypothetical protein